MQLDVLAPWAALIAALIFFLALDLHFFARGREPSFKEAAWWSVGWLVLSLQAAIPVLLLNGTSDAVTYTTVYFIERSLSLDNLFVFLLLFAYFGVPYERRPRLLYWGIVAALSLRGLFILGGSELIEQFHAVIYLLGGALIVLAFRIWRGVAENVDPDRNLMVRLVRRVYPVTGELHGKHWFVREGGRRFATPLFLCLGAIVSSRYRNRAIRLSTSTNSARSPSSANTLPIQISSGSRVMANAAGIESIAKAMSANTIAARQRKIGVA